MNQLIKKLDSLKEPILINNILPISENKNILSILTNQTKWYFGHEGNYNEKPLYDVVFSNDYPHMGMTLSTAENGHKDFNDHPLNIYARVISSIISSQLKFQYKSINRVYWNYYFKGQGGIGHVDSQTTNNISVVYNLMDSDGGTEILDKFYPDIEGQAKIFKSDWWHKGVSTKLDKSRLSLNIVYDL